MRKRVRQLKTKRIQAVHNLDHYFKSYDPVTLTGALNSLESSVAWGIFVAYARMVQRQYEVEALDLLGKEGSTKSAAFASGYAKGVEDVHQLFMTGLINTINNVSLAVENPPPEEAEIGS